CRSPPLSLHDALPILRQEIRRMLAQGRSRDEILQTFADRYGAWVVYMPPRHGWYLLGWAGPFLAVAAGAGVLVWWWRGRRPDLRSEEHTSELQSREKL